MSVQGAGGQQGSALAKDRRVARWPSVYRHPPYVAFHLFLPGRFQFVWRDRTSDVRWGVTLGSVTLMRRGVARHEVSR